eukprot:Hpha_TRINITY_DN33049_c0_g1::TRINITY_DN33049_c0_g1_i1::g.158666::m.158666
MCRAALVGRHIGAGRAARALAGRGGTAEASAGAGIGAALAGRELSATFRSRSTRDCGVPGVRSPSGWGWRGEEGWAEPFCRRRGRDESIVLTIVLARSSPLGSEGEARMRRVMAAAKSVK